ncbi:MAG: PCP reductase family protein [Nitrospirota bacterium]|nr:PCP reductase family protein [Nitrospirota bacterium]
MFESIPQTTEVDIAWTKEALDRMDRAPLFLRGMVKRLAERKAHELGYTEITDEILDQFKSQMMGRMGGESGMAAAADQMGQGKIPWTAAAKARLETVPEFMRHMIQQIAEELAAERGHLEVNIELFEKVEALGDVQDQAASPMTWTDGARARLQDKIRNSPPIAMDFVTDMLKRDTEDLAREKGLSQIDEATLVQLWDAPQERVLWSDEAWKRLLTSPDFVRSGIRKAAERRARKLGLAEIDSEHLTKFRNEAMMKAVKRIRSFGYNDLTFDAFETALGKTKRLQGNEQAEKRLDEIRQHFKDPATQKPEGGTLGAELMGRFRKYLKGEGSL